jgi:hypothetical protein
MTLPLSKTRMLSQSLIVWSLCAIVSDVLPTDIELRDSCTTLSLWESSDESQVMRVKWWESSDESQELRLPHRTVTPAVSSIYTSQWPISTSVLPISTTLLSRLACRNPYLRSPPSSWTSTSTPSSPCWPPHHPPPSSASSDQNLDIW